MTHFDTLLLDKNGHIAVLTLNRPNKLNAINQPMVAELIEAFRDVAQDDDVRVLVMTGAGHAFCAGHDMGEGKGPAISGHSGTVAQDRQTVRRGQRVVTVLREIDKPVIAMVNGVAVGGGFDLALACDIRLGSENTRLRAYTHIGLIPTLAAAWLMPRIIGLSKSAEVLFTGDFIEAKDALRMGLLDRLVSAQDLEKETMGLAHKIAKSPPVAVRLAKDLLYRGLEASFETYLAMAASNSAIAGSSDDHKEAVAGFREKKEPKFKGQ